MSRRARHLSLALAALVAGAAIAVALPGAAPVGAAAPATASFTAEDFEWHVTGGAGTTATIAVGGTVTFGYPSGASAHNADFSGSSPTSCTQTAGPDLGAVPPLPATPAGPGWSGNCRFDTPGTYAFVCDAHASMHGTIDVVDPTAGTTTGPPAGTVPGSSTPTPGGSPSRPARPRVSVAHRQRGVVMRGAVTTPAGPSRIVATALVSNRALSERRPKHVRKVRVGLRRQRSTGTGKTAFAVKLNAAARRALHRRHRLVVDLRIVVTPPAGRAVATTVSVVLRERRTAAGSS